MRAYIAPKADGGSVEVEIEDGDKLSYIVAQMSLPYLRRRLERANSDHTPVIENADLPAWLRAKGDDDQPPIHDGREAERWTYVLGEMIWAMDAVIAGRKGMMKHLVKPGEYDLKPNPGKPDSYEIITRTPGVVDMEGVRNDGERRREGLRLFARYMGGI